MSDSVPGRRALLASAAALPLLAATAGCRSSDAFAGPDPLAGRPPLGHDVLALQAVIAAEERMVELYWAAVVAGPQEMVRSRMLSSLLAEHEQHLARLRARLVEPAGQPSPSRSPAAGPTAGAGLAGTAGLRDAERASAAGLVRWLAMVQPALAQLFASIAASDATHAMVLGS